jgi:hypothetical protein
MVTTVFSAFEYDVITAVVSFGLILILIIWSLVNSKETPYLQRLNGHIEIYVIPLLMMLIFSIFFHNLRIIMSNL